MTCKIRGWQKKILADGKSTHSGQNSARVVCLRDLPNTKTALCGAQSHGPSTHLLGFSWFPNSFFVERLRGARCCEEINNSAENDSVPDPGCSVLPLRSVGAWSRSYSSTEDPWRKPLSAAAEVAEQGASRYSAGALWGKKRSYFNWVQALSRLRRITKLMGIRLFYE